MFSVRYRFGAPWPKIWWIGSASWQRCECAGVPHFPAFGDATTWQNPDSGRQAQITGDARQDLVRAARRSSDSADTHPEWKRDTCGRNGWEMQSFAAPASVCCPLSYLIEAWSQREAHVKSVRLTNDHGTIGHRTSA